MLQKYPCGILQFEVCLSFSPVHCWVWWVLHVHPLLLICSLYPFTLFLSDLYHLLLSSSLLNSDVQFNFLIYISLFCCLTLRGGKKLKIYLSFAQFMQVFFPPFLTAGSIRNNDILGKYHSVFESELSWIVWPLQISLNPLKPWMAGSPCSPCNCKKHCGGTLTCLYFYEKITRNMICY